jgi:hypothetical protein
MKDYNIQLAYMFCNVKEANHFSILRTKMCHQYLCLIKLFFGLHVVQD